MVAVAVMLVLAPHGLAAEPWVPLWNFETHG